MTILQIVQPISVRMGLRTGKERAQLVPRPIGWVLADVLCSLARSGHDVRQVHQRGNGCPGGHECPRSACRLGKSREALNQIFAHLA